MRRWRAGSDTCSLPLPSVSDLEGPLTTKPGATIEDFKRHTSAIASGPCTYGLVPKEHWEEPAWIDETKAAAARQKMAEDKVIYGDSKVYRCVSRPPSGPPLSVGSVLRDPRLMELVDASRTGVCAGTRAASSIATNS